MDPGPSNFNIGDKVFVVNWGSQYSSIGGGIGVFWKNDPRIENYSSTDFFVKIIRGTKADGKPFKKPWMAPIVKREYPWKNFKWEVFDLMPHPNFGEYLYEERFRERFGHDKTKTRYVYLLRSINHADFGFVESLPCYTEVGEDGLSELTPEQFRDKEFNALKDSHKSKWTPETVKDFEKQAPELVQQVYDQNDNVLFGSNMVKGKVAYNYVPGEFMTTGRPYILHTSILYDGKGNEPGMKIVTWDELKQMFPDNKFGR